MSTSVIIPYYNHGRHLRAAVQSALAAGDSVCEIVIINDGSVESRKAQYLQGARSLSEIVRIVDKENGGLSSARNFGIQLARGEFIQFLDSDDLLYPNKVDIQSEHLSANSDIVASICQYSLCNAECDEFVTEYDSIFRFAPTIDSFLHLWERGFSVPIHCALFRRSALSAASFPVQLSAKEDWVFWTELLDRYPAGLGLLPILGAAYRMHPGSMTRDPATMMLAFMDAVEIIDRRWGERKPTFRPAARAWIRSYYTAAIENQALSETPPPTRALTPPIKPNTNPIVREPAVRADSKPGLYSGPTVDAVIPVFNHYEHLEKCIGSALAQCAVSEVIVVNDGSTDPRVDQLLSEIANSEPRVKLISLPSNGGISAAQNLGVRGSKAEFIAFLDCDDFLPEGAVARLVNHFDGLVPDYAFSDRVDVDEAGAVLRIAKYGGYDWIKPGDSIEDDLALGMIASHLKLIRRTTIEAVGGFDPNLDGVQDWDLALRLCGTATFGYVPQPLYFHRVHAASVTTGNISEQIWKSNVARSRHFANRARHKQIAKINQLGSFDNIRLLVERALKEDVELHYHRNDAMDPHELALLREFNSLFDTIKIASQQTPALFGYLSNPNSLTRS